MARKGCWQGGGASKKFGLGNVRESLFKQHRKPLVFFVYLVVLKESLFSFHT